MTTLSRRHFMGRTAAFGLTLPTLSTRAFAQDRIRMHIGTVLPGRTGPEFVRASINDVIGTAARNGANLADIGIVTAAPAPVSLDLLFASSPTPEAAIRAGERLVQSQGVKALIGGVGEGQADVLAEIAARTGVLFLNIGDTSDALRARDVPTMFHIEASDAMYLDALAQLAASKGQMKWAVIADRTARGQALAARAVVAAQKVGASVVETISVMANTPVYYTEMDQLKASDADVVMVLVDIYDQTGLLIQYEENGNDTPVLLMPHTLSQTRDFIASLRRFAPKASPAERIVLWETTDPRPEAADFNLQIRARYASPADPSAWAAYSAVKIISEAVIATQSDDPAVLAAHLVDAQSTFDLSKGTPLSFRPWDRQLRQPLNVITVDPDIQWKLLELQTHINMAKFTATLPADLSVVSLDSLGDVPA